MKISLERRVIDVERSNPTSFTLIFDLFIKETLSNTFIYNVIDSVS